MIIFLRILFAVILISMLGVTGWASSEVALFSIPSGIISHPWFVATLVDAYWAFITFFLWVAWKEGRAVAKVLWFFAIILLGNFAMAAYVLRELFRVPVTSPLAPVVCRRNPGDLFLPGLLAVLAVAIYLLA